jgi:hypothetical protein
MKIWRLVPLFPDSLAMITMSRHRGIAIVRARSEIEARLLADVSFAPFSDPDQIGSIWGDSSVVICVEQSAGTLSPIGHPEVLVPAPDRN